MCRADVRKGTMGLYNSATGHVSGCRQEIPRIFSPKRVLDRNTPIFILTFLGPICTWEAETDLEAHKSLSLIGVDPKKV